METNFKIKSNRKTDITLWLFLQQKHARYTYLEFNNSCIFTIPREDIFGRIPLKKSMKGEAWSQSKFSGSNSGENFPRTTFERVPIPKAEVWQGLNNIEQYPGSNLMWGMGKVTLCVTPSESPLVFDLPLSTEIKL